MARVKWTLAHSLEKLLVEVDNRYPSRSKLSDGTIGDPAHASRKSDHNPDAGGIVRALDLTNDPEHGFDAHGFVRDLAARGDLRVSYLISCDAIWNPSDAQDATYARLLAAGESPEEAARLALPGWRPYTGPNAHLKHAHVSVLPTAAAATDTRSWFPTPEEEEEEMASPTDALDAVTPDGQRAGTWVLSADGAVRPYRGAPHYGDFATLPADDRLGHHQFGSMAYNDARGYDLFDLCPERHRYRFTPC